MKKWLILAAKIAVSAVCVYLIVLKVEWGKLVRDVRAGDMRYLLAAAGVGAVFNLMKFAKWHVLIRAGGRPYSFWHAARSYMAGNALGIVTPMRVGDLGRALCFASHDRPRIVALTVLDRVLDLAAVVVLSVAGSAVLIGTAFSATLALTGLVSLAMLCFPGTFLRAIAARVHHGTTGAALGRLARAATALSSPLMLTSLALSFAAFALTILEFYFMVSAFENVPLSTTALVTPLITLSALLPVTFMGLGVREGLSMYLFSILHVSAPAALSAAFLGFLFNNVSISLIGVVFLTRNAASTRDAHGGAANAEMCHPESS